MNSRWVSDFRDWLELVGSPCVLSISVPRELHHLKKNDVFKVHCVIQIFNPLTIYMFQDWYILHKRLCKSNQIAIHSHRKYSQELFACFPPRSRSRFPAFWHFQVPQDFQMINPWHSRSDKSLTSLILFLFPSGVDVPMSAICDSCKYSISLSQNTSFITLLVFFEK